MCQRLRRSLDSGLAAFAWDAPKGMGIEGTRVCDEAESLAAWCSRSCWDVITQEELPADLTGAARQEDVDFMQDWYVWDSGPCCRELECGWQGTSPTQVGRRQQGRLREACGSQQVCRERIREHQLR